LFGCATTGRIEVIADSTPTQFEGAWINGNVKYVFTNTAGGSGGFRYTYEFKNNNSILNFTEITGSRGPAQSTGDFTKQP
jgi:hypothetical protein